MIMKAENIDINSQKMKRLVKKIQEIRKGIWGLYKKEEETRLGHERDIMRPHVVLCVAYQRERMAYQNS